MDIGYPIGATIFALLFGDAPDTHPARVKGAPEEAFVTNRAGKSYWITRQNIVTLRHTLAKPDPETGELIPSHPYLDERPQSVKFMRVRPIDGTEVYSPEKRAKVSYEPVEGLDFVDIDGVATALTFDDLDSMVGSDVTVWQKSKRVAQVDLETR